MSLLVRLQLTSTTEKVDSISKIVDFSGQGEIKARDAVYLRPVCVEYVILLLHHTAMSCEPMLRNASLICITRISLGFLMP